MKRERRRKMPVIAREGWIQWLDTHGTRRVYDENPTRVLDLCKDGATVLAKFETLARSKNVVLLTKAAMGNKLQTTFYHSVVGVPIRPEEQHYVAMSGKFGRGGRIGHHVTIQGNKSSVRPVATRYDEGRFIGGI